MKMLAVKSLYPGHLRYLRKHFRDPGDGDLADRRGGAMSLGVCSWFSSWGPHLGRLGIESRELIYALEDPSGLPVPENFLLSPDLTLLLQRIREFAPDILFFNDHDEKVLKTILDDNPEIKMVMGWSGSAIPSWGVLKHLDLVLSCAPEAVSRLQKKGFRAYHIHHGFDPEINQWINFREKQQDVIFIGQIQRSRDYHLAREELLLYLARKIPLKIFATERKIQGKKIIKNTVKKVICMAYGQGSLGRAWISGISPQKVDQWRKDHLFPVHPRLAPYLNPPVFGIDMFQALADSRIVLNSHADSSPLFASNMRLFEATGVGSCLLTDWKQNIRDLFEPDEEVVVYRTPAECAEKARWLLAHPEERERIARAGQERMLKSHTVGHRAEQFFHILREVLP